MKKQLLLPILFLLFNISCEDSLEGNITPSTTNIGDFENPSNEVLYWKFSFLTVGKGNNTYQVGTNPTSKSVIYVKINDGVIIDAWAENGKYLTIKTSGSTSQATQSYPFELTTPGHTTHGQPSEAPLPKLSGCSSKFYPLDPQTKDEKCITVHQYTLTTSCTLPKRIIPTYSTTEDTWIYVPQSL